MKKLQIVSWNCNTPWNAKDPDSYRKRKLEKIQNQYKDADIFVLQEISSPGNRADATEWWEGLQSVKRLNGVIDNNVRGISIILNNSDLTISKRSTFKEKALFGLPCNIKSKSTGESFNLLGIWNWPFVEGLTYSRGKNVGQAKPHYLVSLKEIFNQYKDFLIESEKTVAIGDFNWTMEAKAKSEHAFFEELQKSFSLTSCYHKTFKKEFEDTASSGPFTLYIHKDKNKSHVVDYALTGKGISVDSLEVGTFEDFSDCSDHTPLILDLSI